MTTFEIALLLILGVIAVALLGIGVGLGALQREVAEIWKRMPRLD